MSVRTLISILVLVAACKSDDPVPDFPDASTPDAALDAPASCFDPAGTPARCFLQSACEPDEDTDFLNGCTSGQCLPYDNVVRLPRFNNGNLPPLP